MDEYELINNIEESRYEFRIEDFTAVLQYEYQKENLLAITHVGVPKELEGQGIASELMRQVLIDIEDNGQKIRPLCSFAVAYINKHPEWEGLL